MLPSFLARPIDYADNMPTNVPHNFSFSRREAIRSLALLAAGAAAPRFLFAQKPAASPAPSPSATPPPVASRNLADRLSLITGAGGNIAVLTGDDGTLLIDCGVPAAIMGLIGEVAKVAPTPASIVVNTHWHFDHTGGNEQLAKNGARIIAHDNCRKRLATDQYMEFMDRKVPASPHIALPVATFDREMQLHVNGEDLKLTAVPPAHTDNDIIIQFPNANVLHVGDLYFNGFYPFIDYSSGGWIGGMAAAIKTASGMVDAKTKIIPGHGPMAMPDDMKFYLTFLETMNDRLGKMKQQGKSVDEAIAAAPTKDFDEKLGGGFLKPDMFVKCTYTGLLKHG
jgi:glyoxylase-like metal-dependent hydrolase (beta-lactamase superfamily II)